MLSSAALAPFNHILLSESWAKIRLQLHAGKTVKLCITPLLSIALTVQDNGELSAAAIGDNIDTTVTFAFGLLPRLFTRDEDAYSEICISGDNVFAEELIYIGKNLHWDVEQDLSLIMGDIFAHRIVQTSKDIKYWHNETAQNLSEAMTEYWLEEQPLLAKSSHIKEFFDDVNILSKKVEQLEIRIEKMTRKDS